MFRNKDTNWTYIKNKHSAIFLIFLIFTVIMAHISLVAAVVCCVVAQLPIKKTRHWLDKIDVGQVSPSMIVFIYGEELLWHEEFRIKRLPFVKLYLTMHLCHRKKRTSLGIGFYHTFIFYTFKVADAQWGWSGCNWRMFSFLCLWSCRANDYRGVYMCASLWVLHLYHSDLSFQYPIIMCAKEGEDMMTGWGLLLVSHCLHF